MKIKDIIKEIINDIPYLCKVEYPEDDSITAHAFTMALTFISDQNEERSIDKAVGEEELDEDELIDKINDFGTFVNDSNKAQKVIEKFAEYLWEEYFQESADLCTNEDTVTSKTDSTINKFIEMIEKDVTWNDSLRVMILNKVQEIAPKYTKDKDFIENMFDYVEYSQELDILITEGFEEIWKNIDSESSIREIYEQLKSWMTEVKHI